MVRLEQVFRYSTRQDRKMNMGGLVGSVVYEGNIEQFIPFIYFTKRSISFLQCLWFDLQAY